MQEPMPERNLTTTLTSFIVRFVQEREAEGVTAAWHGFIRHVQSCEEMRFTRIEEALRFMEGFVDLSGTSPQESNPEPR